jgi:Co/Zn/Cd efflux system component
MSDCGCNIEIKDKEQKRVLYLLLAINALMFVVELSIGWFAESTGLIADSLDNLADAIVYSIGLYAVGRAASDKAKAALLSGYFQAILGSLIVIDIARRTVMGSEPESVLMIGVGVVALLANTTCLILIKKHKDGDAHMRASWIFSANDVIANLGIIIGGGLVWWLDSRWPDIVIGTIVMLVILRGARLIIKDAKNELNQ